MVVVVCSTARTSDIECEANGQGLARREAQQGATAALKNDRFTMQDSNGRTIMMQVRNDRFTMLALVNWNRSANDRSTQRITCSILSYDMYVR